MKTNGNTPARPVLITGGAGFIGANLANRLLDRGRRVILYDNLSRPGVERNLKWLTSRHDASAIRFECQDVRDAKALAAAVAEASAVYHFAAQVAVTTSLDDPAEDFEVNARGTLNVLEAVRRSGRQIPLLFTSTNKVYGELDDVALEARGERYVSPTDDAFDEARVLSFHSPYGCSKGAADQYVLDHARTFGLPTVVFRMSCIYGPRQFGTEDQGWVAHFLIQALKRRPITIYGDGRQVRDILFVDDLVDAMLLALDRIERTRGQAFNIGGGLERTISLRELLAMVEEITGVPVEVRHEAWRAADQKYYVSDTSRFTALTGWRPQVDVRQGVERLCRWLKDQPASRAVAAATSPANA
jgi:CDP-paratose 2-epimerase